MHNNSPWPLEKRERLYQLWVVENRSADYCAKELGFETRNPVCGQVARTRKQLIADGKPEAAALWARGNNGSNSPKSKPKPAVSPKIIRPRVNRPARSPAVSASAAKPRPTLSTAQKEANRKVAIAGRVRDFGSPVVYEKPTDEETFAQWMREVNASANAQALEEQRRQSSGQ